MTTLIPNVISRNELIALAQRAAKEALRDRKGVRRSASVYVTEQTQPMYRNLPERFRTLVTAAPPHRWFVRDSELHIVERIVMQAEWARATDEASLVAALLSSLCECGHAQADHGSFGCDAVTGPDTTCADSRPCWTFVPITIARAA